MFSNVVAEGFDTLGTVEREKKKLLGDDTLLKRTLWHLVLKLDHLNTSVECQVVE